MTITAHDIVAAALATPPYVPPSQDDSRSTESVSRTPTEHVEMSRPARPDRRITEYQPVSGFEPSDAWASSAAVKFESTCPSGQRVLLRHITPLDAIEFDLAEDVDVFTRRLQSDGDSGHDPFWRLMRDPIDRLRFMSLLNRIAAAMSVSPMIIDDGVHQAMDADGRVRVVGGAQLDERPDGIPDLPPGAVYASSVDFGDKMHIFREFDKPLAAIAPFRGAADGVENLA